MACKGLIRRSGQMLENTINIWSAIILHVRVWKHLRWGGVQKRHFSLPVEGAIERLIGGLWYFQCCGKGHICLEKLINLPCEQ